MSAKLESLIVSLELETSALRKGLDSANAQLDKFGKKLDSLAGVVSFNKLGSMAVQATSALVNFVRRGAEVDDATGKMAASAGVSVEAFSRLQYASQLGGIGAEDFSVAMAKLNKNISEAAVGSKQQVALFQSLGVSVKDAHGNVKSADAVFTELAETFSKMAPGASKAKLEMDLLGKTGAKFENVFADGAQGLKLLGQEADRFGITISTKAAVGAQQFNDNVERLDLAMNRVGARVAGEVAPAFTKLTSFLLETDAGASLLKETVTVLANILKVLATVAIAVGTAFSVVGTAIGGGIAGAIEALSGNFKGAAEATKLMKEDMAKDIATAGKLITDIWSDADASTTKTAGKFSKNSDDIADAAQRQAKALAEAEQALKSLTQVAEEYEAKVAGFGQSPVGELQAQLEHGKLADQLAKIGDAADAMKQRILAAAEALQLLEAAKLSADLDFDIKRTKRATNREVNSRSAAHDTLGPGATARQQAEFKTAGFDSFDQALHKMAAETNRAARMDASAKQLEFEKDTEGAQWATLQADNARAAAHAAGEAADGFEDIAEIDFEEHKAKIEKMLAGISAIGQQFVKELGDFGDVVDAGIKGAESGGIWGAIIAVIIELLSKFEGFGQIMDIANGLVQGALADLADSLGSVVAGLRPLLGAIGMIFHSLHGVLAPILEVIGGILEGLAPIFAILGLVLKPLGGLFRSIGSVIQTVLEPVMEGLAYVFIGIGLVMSGLQIAVAAVWLALVTAGDEILSAFGNHSLSNARNQANAALQGAIQDADDLAHTDPKKLMDMANAAADSAEVLGKTKDKTDDLGKSAEKTSTALERLSAQFTNVPDGFRINYRRYQSSDPVGGGVTDLGGGTMQNTVVVQGSLIHESQVATWVSGKQKKEAWQKGKRPFA